MDFWTPRQFELVTAGTWLVPPSNDASPLNGVSIDSRTINAEAIFIALPGERFDGHDYVEAAAQSGAAMIIVEQDDFEQRASLPKGISLLQVEDTHATLRQIARAYRGFLAAHDVKVIAVTGSNGKTTTRHLIHAAMSANFCGTQSPKSFNNHIGVPLTLLGASEHDDFVVVEIGTNHPGEVATLGELVCPDAAVIVSVGQEHMEFFGTLDAVAAEETSIAAYVRPGGFVLVPPSPIMDESRVRNTMAERVAWLEVEGVEVTQLDSDDETVSRQRIILSDGATFELPLLGQHNAMNAALAFEVARQFGAVAKSIAEALEEVKPVPMRLQVETIGSTGATITVVNDAYNANPDSMREALAVLALFKNGGKVGRRIAILGDMFELGDQAAHHHAELGREVARYDDIDIAMFVGNFSGLAANALAKVWANERVVSWSRWNDSLPANVADRLEPGDVVLIKASRGMALERLIAGIESKFSDAPRMAV